MKQENPIEEIKNLLAELHEDASVPKNVRAKIEKIMKFLDGDVEPSIKANKALNELEGIADDVNLQSYTRTQIWNAISLLEKVNC